MKDVPCASINLLMSNKYWYFKGNKTGGMIDLSRERKSRRATLD